LYRSTTKDIREETSNTPKQAITQSNPPEKGYHNLQFETAPKFYQTNKLQGRRKGERRVSGI
jgi:hypothetical protein